MPRCPVCGDQVDLATSVAVPFCSDRCRTVDLGRWLGEAYGLPGPAAASDDEDGEHESPQRAADGRDE